MVQFSPILLSIPVKNDPEIERLPVFYLVETIDGHRGVMGAVDPRALARIQRSGIPFPDANSRDELHHGVFFSDVRLPDEWFRGAGINAIPSTMCEVVVRFLSRASACVIGREAELDQAIAAGVASVPFVLWEANNSGLPWLPCHRVISNVENFQSGWMVCLAREHMFFRDVTTRILGVRDNPAFDARVIDKLLSPQKNESVTMLAVAKDGAWRIHSEPGWADGLLEDMHSLLREIPVVQFHHIVLPRGLDLEINDGSQVGHIEVLHDASSAVAALHGGAQVVYLFNPIRSAEVEELIKQGQMLPADSVALDVEILKVWNHAA